MRRVIVSGCCGPDFRYAMRAMAEQLAKAEAYKAAIDTQDEFLFEKTRPRYERVQKLNEPIKRKHMKRLRQSKRR